MDLMFVSWLYFRLEVFTPYHGYCVVEAYTVRQTAESKERCRKTMSLLQPLGNVKHGYCQT